MAISELNLIHCSDKHVSENYLGSATAVLIELIKVTAEAVIYQSDSEARVLSSTPPAK